MWSKVPFEVLSLYAIELEPPVVPTVFASAARAWEALPDGLRARVAELKAVHVSGPEYVHERRRQGIESELVQARRDYVPMITMPVAYDHPRTGRTLLFVAQGMTKEIDGMSPDESEDLLEELFAYLYSPHNVIEHDWRVGDIIFWDNLAVQHARPNVSTQGPARTLRKIGLPIDESLVAASIVNTYESID
jgi:taurine dioxygenase